MKPYIAFFKQCFMTGLQYRAAAVAGMATQYFWGFMYLMIYGAFYSNAATATNFAFAQLVDYIWLQQAFLALIMNWYRDNDLFKLITSGNIAYELCRPMDIYRFWYAKLLAKRLSAALLRFLPIIVCALVIPEPYRLHLPANLISFTFFILAMILGCFLMIALNMFVYLLTMKIMSPMGSLLLYSVAADFMSGTVIPLPFMPERLQNILNYLPFRYTADFSFRIYSGHISGQVLYQGFIIQLTWLALSVVLGKLWMNASLKKVAIQGG